MSLDPLADYLEPQFGNIYDRTFVPSLEWQRAIRQYLIDEVSDNDWAPFLDELGIMVPAGDRATQAAYVAADSDLWEIVFGLRRAQVQAQSTLDEVVGDQTTWPSDGALSVGPFDATLWLEVHSNLEQLVAMVEASGRSDLLLDISPEPSDEYLHLILAERLPEALQPPDLLAAWHPVTVPLRTNQQQPGASKVRSWAQARGYPVGGRGRLPAELYERYRQEAPGTRRAA